MMDWLPIASDFSKEVRSALASSNPMAGLERLACLAQYRLGFLETLQLDKAIGRLTSKPTSSMPLVRLAVLASSTVDHLAPAIRVGGLRRGTLIDVYVGTYGQYRQELFDPASALHQFRPQLVLFSLTARDAIACVPLTATASEVDETIAQTIEELRYQWDKVRETFNATIIQQTFLDITEPIFGCHDCLVPGAPRYVVLKLNDYLAKAAADNGVLLLDVARASMRDGIDVWFDTGRWLQGKLEIAPQAAALFGDMVGRIVAAQRGLSKKCLVLDLDNTLWGGTIGDDGLEGIVLGPGSAPGEAHLSLQRYAKQLSERGVILAVCSKNDPATAESAFRDHPEMVLKWSDIAAFVANWNDKAENLKTIADQLNIGIDSLVFLDDNPAERARIRQSLPMVAVPELPDDVAYYVRCLADAGYFEAVSFTSEDRHRARLYAASTERSNLLASSQSMDEFLRGLKMEVSSGPFTAVDIPRVAQLFNKTNQFNTTARRYTTEEVASFAVEADAVTLQFRLADKFGDNGLVSAMILLPDPERPDTLKIDNWVMSCRVFGRELEFEAMNIAVEAARHRDIPAIRAKYVSTPKNGLIDKLYQNLGFSQVLDTTVTDGETYWILNLADYFKRQTHIARNG
jgi:FkbH-like protein